MLARVTALLALTCACAGSSQRPAAPAPVARPIEPLAPIVTVEEQPPAVHVPGDAALVYAALDPVPIEQVERQYLGFTGFARLAAALDRFARAHRAAYRALPAVVRLWHGLLRATGGALDRERLRAIGLEPSARFALYVRGGATVIRIELSDPAAAGAALARGFAGLAQVHRKGGPRHFHLPGAAGAELAIADGDLVLVTGAQAIREAELFAALGPPPDGHLEVAALAALAERHGLARTGIGTLEPGAFAAPPDDDPASGGCAAELAALLGGGERIVFGVRTRSAARDEMKLVIPLAGALDELTSALGPAPTLSGQAPVAGLAIGVDLGRAFGWAAARLATLPDRRLTCPLLTPLGGTPRRAAASLEALARTALGSIDGVALSIDSLSGVGQPDALKVSGRALIASDDPGALLGLFDGGRRLDRSLAPTATPRQLPLSDRLTAYAPAAFLLGPRAIAIGFGGAAPPVAGPSGTAFLVSRASPSLFAGVARPAGALALDGDLAALYGELEAGSLRHALGVSLTGERVGDAVELTAVVHYR